VAEKHTAEPLKRAGTLGVAGVCTDEPAPEMLTVEFPCVYMPFGNVSAASRWPLSPRMFCTRKRYGAEQH